MSAPIGWALAIIVALLSGCAAPAPGSGINTGDAVRAPYGYEELCERAPSAPECGGR